MTGQDQSAPSYEQTLLAEGGGFVYGTINADVHVFADRGPIYMLENYRTVRKPSSEWLIAQPSRALRADYAVVDFSGRDKELATLSNWRDSSAARLAALWLHGPGGQGKSRLAREFIEQSVHEGWKAVTATHSAGSVVAPPGSQDLRVGDAPGVLLVVDYADRWPVSHLAWLFSNALLHQLTPARILLLARSSHIWPAVRAALTRHEAGLADLPLPALLDERDERERMFAVARDCFAAVYGLPSADLPAVPALHRMEYGLVLAVQTAALVGVDAAARGVRPPQDALTASAYLLDRERQHWTKLFEGRTEGVEFDTRPAEMARAVFVAALTGVTRYQDGRRILEDLNLGSPPDRILRDHAVCYPAAGTTDAFALEPLYPDRLAEDFLALSLPGHQVTTHAADSWAPSALARLLSRDEHGAAPPYVSRALSFLIAAADRWPHVGTDHLYPLLKADLRLILDGGGSVLSALAESQAVPAELLATLFPDLPKNQHTDLAPGIATLTERLVRRELKIDHDQHKQARLLILLADAQGNAGRYAEALRNSNDALPIMRRVAAADPDAYEPDLVMALINLSNNLSDADRNQEALDLATEAAAICRRLIRDSPSSIHEPNLATCLGNIAKYLAALERYEEALQFSTEALEIRRLLSETDPLTRRADLASSLGNFGNSLAMVGRYRESLEATMGALAIRRRLAREDPAAHLPDLANSLANASEFLFRLGCFQDAVGPAEEAATLRRDLARVNPAAHEVNFAVSLKILAKQLTQLGRAPEALEPAAETVAVYRRLCQANPAVYLPSLAASLTTLGGIFMKAERDVEGLEPTAEAISIYRQLAQSDPTAYLPMLATSLDNRSVSLSGAGRLSDALESAQEALEIGRRLTEIDPVAYRPWLASSLHTVGTCLSKLGREEEAVAVTVEAVAIRRELATSDWVERLADLASSLTNLSVYLAEIGRFDEALDTAEEAVQRYRRLVEDNRASYEGDLAVALNSFSYRLSRAGRPQEALAAAWEALAIRRRLAAVNPTMHEPLLGAATHALGQRLWELGQYQQAVDVTREAITIRRKLARADPSAHLSELASSLSNLGVFLSELDGQGAEALEVTREVVAIRRPLAAAYPEAHLPDLGRVSKVS